MRVISIFTVFAVFAHTIAIVNSKQLDILDAILIEKDSLNKRAGELIQTVEFKIVTSNLLAPTVLRFGWSQANLKFSIGSGEFELSVRPAGGQFLEVQGIGNDDLPGAEYLNVDISQMTAVLEYEKGTGRLLSFDPDSGPNKSVEVTNSADNEVNWITPIVTITDGLPRPPG